MGWFNKKQKEDKKKDIPLLPELPKLPELPELKEKIQEIEAKIASLKVTAQNLDETYYTKAIEQEEYFRMKNSLADKIAELMKERNQLKS